MIETESNDGAADLRRALACVAVVGSLESAAAIWLGGMALARSVAIGATLAVGNLWLLTQMVRGFLARKGNAAPLGLVAVLKFVLLFGAMYLLVKTRVVQVLPCVFGFGALPIGIVLAQLFAGHPGPGES